MGGMKSELRASILILLSSTFATGAGSLVAAQESAEPADVARPTDATVSAEITAAELMAHVKALAADGLAALSQWRLQRGLH